jgi:hypothetical protein
MEVCGVQPQLGHDTDTARNLGIILSMLVIFLVTHLVATEYIPAQQSRGEILMFRKGKKKNASRTNDEEARNPNHVVNLSIEGKENMQANKSTNAAQIAKPQIFHWSDVNYSIKTKSGTRNILANIEGWVQPGTLTALMVSTVTSQELISHNANSCGEGVTGAGKTSLLDLLACRTRVGTVSGDICLNGEPRQADFQRKIGYVQQEDIHLHTATVREALEFSAQLRQSKDKTSSQKSEYVDQIIDLLDMESFAEAIVGVPGEGKASLHNPDCAANRVGLNVEQRKRLSIAVEMVARPEILLFLGKWLPAGLFRTSPTEPK